MTIPIRLSLKTSEDNIPLHFLFSNFFFFFFEILVIIIIIFLLLFFFLKFSNQSLQSLVCYVVFHTT